MVTAQAGEMREKAIDKTLNNLYKQIAKLEANRPIYYSILKPILEWEARILEKRRDRDKNL